MNINNGISQYNSYANHIASTASQSLTKDTVSSLQEGQVFEGSINSVDENGRVTIGLANGQTMSARLSDGVSITQGQSLFFQVKSNDGMMVQIKPISLNIESNPTLLKALETASISPNEKSIAMVDMMMKESMPINSESIAAMNRAVLSNPNVSLDTIVQMTKLDLPITSENASMFEAYSTDQAAIMQDVDKLSQGLVNLLSDPNLSVSEAISLNSQFNNIFNSDYVNDEGQLASSEMAGAVASDDLANINGNIQESTNQSVANNMDNVQLLSREDDVVLPQGENESIAGSLPVKDNINLNQALDTNKNQLTEELSLNKDFTGEAVSSNAMPAKQLASVQHLLETFPDFSKVNEKLFTPDGNIRPNVTANELFSAVTKFIDSNPDIPRDHIKDLFSSKEYKSLLNSVINNSFSMDPKEITKPGSISKLYERVLKQTEQLEQLVSAVKTKSAEAIKDSTSNIKNNINFMNSANELYNFVQIPLKMFEQHTDSMLYVRQNKKKAYENGEEITAFLHFDMTYLGSTDIFIRLKERNVSCDWKLENESSLKLIEDNLDILNKRLEEKGYNSKMSVSSNLDIDYKEDFFKPKTGDASGLVHRYSFDMRA